MEVPAELFEAMTGYIERTANFAQKQAELEQSIATSAPNVIDTLIKCGFVTESHREVALQAARDPLKVLECLHKVAARKAVRQDVSVPSMGGAGEIKEAGVAADKTLSPAMVEANARFLRSIGLR